MLLSKLVCIEDQKMNMSVGQGLVKTFIGLCHTKFLTGIQGMGKENGKEESGNTNG